MVMVMLVKTFYCKGKKPHIIYFKPKRDLLVHVIKKDGGEIISGKMDLGFKWQPQCSLRPLWLGFLLMKRPHFLLLHMGLWVSIICGGYLPAHRHTRLPSTMFLNARNNLFYSWLQQLRWWNSLSLGNYLSVSTLCPFVLRSSLPFLWKLHFPHWFPDGFSEWEALVGQ